MSGCTAGADDLAGVWWIIAGAPIPALVRYFTAVADHRHFGRAAEVLCIAQPSLSRQIRSLEQQLGARLLDRTPQGTQLTEAGEVFLPRAKALLRTAAQAAAHTRAAADCVLRSVVQIRAGLLGLGDCFSDLNPGDV
jgi:DNA-binding transcriptional LysR family regulator